ncbi:MAG: Zn-ribbon domain-containing OB-fold protein [Candidatus Odinarchaeia archaeon]
MDNSEKTIKQFLQFINEGKLKALKCKSCSKILLPPRVKCKFCKNSEFEWVDLKGTGRLLTYTIIYIAPKKFLKQAPYAIGIIELDEGVKVEARINSVNIENHEKELRTGMRLIFDSEANVLSFKPI